MTRGLSYIVSKFGLYIQHRCLERWPRDYPTLFLSMGYPLSQEWVSKFGSQSDIISLPPNTVFKRYTQTNSPNHSGQVAKFIKVRRYCTSNYGSTKANICSK